MDEIVWLSVLILFTLGCIGAQEDCEETVCDVELPDDINASDCRTQCISLGYSESETVSDGNCTPKIPNEKEGVIQCSYYVGFPSDSGLCCCRHVDEMACGGDCATADYSAVCAKNKPSIDKDGG